MERYPSPKFGARMHFFYLKNSVRIKLKHEKVLLSWKRLELSQNPQNFSLRRIFWGVLQGIIIGFKLYRRKMFQNRRYF